MPRLPRRVYTPRLVRWNPWDVSWPSCARAAKAPPSDVRGFRTSRPMRTSAASPIRKTSPLRWHAAHPHKHMGTTSVRKCCDLSLLLSALEQRTVRNGQNFPLPR